MWLRACAALLPPSFCVVRSLGSRQPHGHQGRDVQRSPDAAGACPAIGGGTLFGRRISGKVPGTPGRPAGGGRGAEPRRWTAAMYLGLDLGTSGVKAMLIDRRPEGHRASATAPLDVSRPHPGWSEQDPAHWIRGHRSRRSPRCSAEPGSELAAVRGIGLSGHMHGATLLDADDKVLRPCILWNDTRSLAEAAELDADPRFRAITGNIVFPGFTAPKLVWVKNNEPEIFAQGRQGAAAEGLSAALADGRAYFRNVGFGRHHLARYRRAQMVAELAGRDRSRREPDAGAGRRHARSAARCAANSPRELGHAAGRRGCRRRRRQCRLRLRHGHGRGRARLRVARHVRRAVCRQRPLPAESRKAPFTPSAMRCRTPGTRWA